MNVKSFLKAGHTPTLLSAFFYFDMSFMVWVLLGSLGVQIAKDMGLNAAEKGLMVAVPVLAGALLRLVNGVLVDRIGPKRAGIISQVAVIAGLGGAWLLGVHSYTQVLMLGLVLGIAGSSFAIALPLASRWYPPEHQGLALGIAGAGNSGTVLASLFAPGLATLVGWQNVIGLAALPLIVALAVYLVCAKDSPEQPAPKAWRDYLDVLKVPDAWWFMLFYGVTFGGFVGLGSSLTIYFNSEFQLGPVVAGFFTAACVFAGSFLRPVGGAMADRFGGIRTLSVMYAIAAAALIAVSLPLHTPWAALAILIVVMGALGMGNGAIFQLVPQRFRGEIGVMTGLVGMTGGVGGFYLASSLGLAKQVTGAYQAGFLGFAVLALLALASLSGVKRVWRATWGDLAVQSARV
ncbi:MAG TPA: nitrate/nitrite transporter [Caulobacteraceae bacterium]|jgi:NNP family nitrate/nitrite transporter-like MFS transporter|nr:nitrate/nitrite transporter [Caulobacteraceae bacterium]